jgi:group I intron endonuclease
MIVYVITNTVNGKVYIGKTINTVQRRWTLHKYLAKCGTAGYFYNAIRKFGSDVFTLAILATANSLEELNQLEVKFIEQYNSRSKKSGYNIRIGGEGGNFTEETLKKIRASHRTPEFRAKQSAIMKGKNAGHKHTEEWKQRQSQRNSGMGNPMFGKTPWLNKHHSEATKEKLSQDRQGSNNPMFGKPGPMTGRKHTEATKEKMRAARLAALII